MERQRAPRVSQHGSETKSMFLVSAWALGSSYKRTGVYIVKINKQKPHIKWIQEARRGSSMQYMDSGAQQEELCVYNDSPDFLFSSLEKFPLFLGTCVWFTIRPHVQNCNSLSFLNKLILLEKYLASYLFKVNSIFTFVPALSGQNFLRPGCMACRSCQKKGGYREGESGDQMTSWS